MDDLALIIRSYPLPEEIDGIPVERGSTPGPIFLLKADDEGINAAAARWPYPYPYEDLDR